MPTASTNELKICEKWKAIDGFGCAVVLIVVSFLTNRLLWSVYDHNAVCAEWLDGHPRLTEGALMLFQSISSLIIVFLFSRTKHRDVFFASVGLNRKPTIFGWMAAWLSICIGFLALYGVTKHLIAPNQLSRSFHYYGGFAKWFFIIYAVLIGPFCEEVVRRGFLYRAFRGSYKPAVSMFFVLCVHTYFHWGLISTSLYVFMCLLSLEILLCMVMELTGNVWNCVLCHAAYNAIQNLPWYIFPAMLIIYLPIIIYRDNRKFHN